MTEELLRAAFVPFGDVRSVSLPRDFTSSSSSSSASKSGSGSESGSGSGSGNRSNTRGNDAGGEQRGYGFVEFESAEDAATAIDNMNGAELYGRTIEVSVARPMKEQKSKAVWEDMAEPAEGEVGRE
jgi:peptidyl-prolyl isomerase E (cyclophilin E)